jgi:hypothetical protein
MTPARWIEPQAIEFVTTSLWDDEGAFEVERCMFRGTFFAVDGPEPDWKTPCGRLVVDTKGIHVVDGNGRSVFAGSVEQLAERLVTLEKYEAAMKVAAVALVAARDEA